MNESLFLISAKGPVLVADEVDIQLHPAIDRGRVPSMGFRGTRQDIGIKDHGFCHRRYRGRVGPSFGDQRNLQVRRIATHKIERSLKALGLDEIVACLYGERSFADRLDDSLAIQPKDEFFDGKALKGVGPIFDRHQINGEIGAAVDPLLVVRGVRLPLLHIGRQIFSS